MTPSQGKKRASPGADIEKQGPLGAVDLSQVDSEKLREVSKALERVDLAVELLSQEKHAPVWEKRRHILKAIPKFWPIAFMNHPQCSNHAAHAQDQAALSHLEDVWIARHPEEKRCFTIEFHFKENPYFSDSVLKKEYKYLPAAAAAGDIPDENGITDTMCQFAWDENVAPQAIKINWKEDSRNLTKLHPQVFDEEDDLPSEPGSFFNFFEKESDPYDLGIVIAHELFPDVIDWFLGTNQAGDDDSDEEYSEEDDENEDEIDLEKPRTKKQRM